MDNLTRILRHVTPFSFTAWASMVISCVSILHPDLRYAPEEYTRRSAFMLGLTFITVLPTLVAIGNTVSVIRLN